MSHRVDHPAHEHPLILLDFYQGKVNRVCDLCFKNISTEAYSCTQGCGYYNHRLCAMAPLLIEVHPLHPAHPLTLIHGRPRFRCDACDEKFENGCSSFRCDECDFDLDTGCALSTLLDLGGSEGASSERIALENHPHPVTWFSLRGEFVRDGNCVVCGASVDEDGFMCLRRSCEFFIHKGCIPDLFNVDGTKSPLQHPTHEHPLKPLDLRLQNHHPLCSLCYRKIFTKAYACRKCNYYYHRVCGEATHKIECHPLHPAHPLTLSHLRSSFNCIACGECPDPSGSTFSCEECFFELDICCALYTLSDQGGSPKGTTPDQIIHPLHHHRLTSFSTRHDLVRGSNCNFCWGSVERDGYVCLNGSCEFQIHKSCIPDLYYPDGTKAPLIYHFHQLEIFLGEDKGSTKCAFCGSDESGEFIGCATCKVFYHRHCIGLAETLHYPPHRVHTLILVINRPDIPQKCRSCSSSLEDDELCYGCLHCSFFVHVGCAVQTLAYCEEGMRASINWMGHEHPLLLSHGAESGSNYCCDYCLDKSTGPMYVCQEHDCGF